MIISAYFTQGTLDDNLQKENQLIPLLELL